MAGASSFFISSFFISSFFISSFLAGSTAGAGSGVGAEAAGGLEAAGAGDDAGALPSVAASSELQPPSKARERLSPENMVHVLESFTDQLLQYTQCRAAVRTIEDPAAEGPRPAA